MIVLMTGVAAMLGLCVVLLQLLMKLDADSRARLDGRDGALARLAEQFRLDVHAARSARLVDGPAGGTARSGCGSSPGADRTIDYQVKGDATVVRVENPAREPRSAVSVTRSRGAARSSSSLEQEKSGRSFASLAVDRVVAKNRTDPPRRCRGAGAGGQEQGPGFRRGQDRGSEAMNVHRVESEPPAGA